MLLLTSTSDLIQIITASAGTINVHTSYVDNNAGVITPGRTNTPTISTATTTTIVASPGSGVQRNVRLININNTSVSVNNLVTIQHTDGTTVEPLIDVLLAFGETLEFNETGNWTYYSTTGMVWTLATINAAAWAIPGAIGSTTRNTGAFTFVGIGTPSTATAYKTIAAGTTTVAPVVSTAGTNLTTAVAGAQEFDGVNSYITNETSSGRGVIPVEQYFHLIAAGTGITTIANFFGTTSNISLVSGAYYEIDIYCFFTMGSTASVVTWTLTNSAAPTYMDLIYEMSPVTGIVAPPGTGTMLEGEIIGGVTAAQTVVTASLTLSTKQYAHFKIFLQNGTGTSLKIQAAETTTTTAMIPNIGSSWRCVRRPAGNIGTFAA
jgi:hypothetical protein